MIRIVGQMTDTDPAGYPRELRPGVPSWEYRVFDTGVTNNNSVSRLQDMLNDFGRDGWELVRITPNSPTAISKAAVQYVFKRQTGFVG